MVKNWAFIYCSPGCSANEHTTVVNSAHTQITMIGLDVKDRDQSIDIAKDLVKNGCQMIELCGAFGPLYVAKIKEATGYSIPVGAVMYGPEDRGPMLAITTPQAS